MLDGWWILLGVLSAFGLPLVVVGVILWLCERSWEKPLGSMGSMRLLTVGLLLCLPVLIYLGPALLEILLEKVGSLCR